MNQLWAARNPRERFLIFVCIGVVIIGGGMMLFPQENVNKKLLSTAQARHRYGRALSQRSAMEDEMKRLKPRIEKIVHEEAPEQLVPRVIRTLQGYAKESGIHLREIKPLRARKLATVTRVPLSVRFTGQFSAGIPFLYKIEDPAGKLVVDKFNVTTSDPKLRNVDVEVEVATYTRFGSNSSDKVAPASPAGTGGIKP